MTRCIALLLAAALLAGCSSENLGCPGIDAAPIVVFVQDSSTGERLCDANVRGTRGDESFVGIQGGVLPNCNYVVNVDTGTYEVEVEADGYDMPAPQTATVVRSGECQQLQTVTLNFELTPSSE